MYPWFIPVLSTMAEDANEDRWEVEGGEDNVVIDSAMMLNIADDQSSSATSYSASVTNSPLNPVHSADQASIPEDAQR